MKKYPVIALFTLIALAFSGCNDEEENGNMVWELVSNSDADMIVVSIDTDDSFSSSANIRVHAGYKSGDIELRCVNHTISRLLAGANDSYTNPDMGFAISMVDNNTLRVHFDENASGKPEETDLITVTNADGKPAVCNTLLWVTRSFGELSTDKPEGIPDKYRFRLAEAGFMPFMNDDFQVPAPFDNLSFILLDYLDRYSPLGIPEFVEPYDSIVWSAKGMPDTYRIYERNSDENSLEEKFTSRWSTHFFTSGSGLMSYAKGYSEGKVIYSDSLRIYTYERGFLCFDWARGSVALINPYTTGIYCLLDKSREYNVVDVQEINDTRYCEIHVWNHKYLSDDNFLSFSREALIKLMKENIGDGMSAQGKTDVFKCIPEGIEAELVWENKTTRIALLHELPSDTALEGYYLLVEANYR